MTIEAGKLSTDELLAMEEQDNARFRELKAKDELTQEEQEEMAGLKERHQSRSQKRFDKLTWEAKSAKEEAERVKQEKSDLERRLQELERGHGKRESASGADFIEIDGEKYLTDSAIKAKVKSGDITEDEAYDLHLKRIQAEAVVKAESRVMKKIQEQETYREQKAAFDWIKENYPQIDPKSSDHDPEDPVTRLTLQLVEDGLGVQGPLGVKKAILRAKEILGSKGSARPDKNTRHDRGDDFSFDRPGAGERGQSGKGGKDLEISAEEKDLAEDTFCNQTNPKTGKFYTPQEAHVKYAEAKKRRLGKE